MSSFILPALILLGIYFVIRKGKKIREQESVSNETRYVKEVEPQEIRIRGIDIYQIDGEAYRRIFNNNGMYEYHNKIINMIENQFKSKNEYFVYTHKYYETFGLLEHQYSAVIGSLSDRQLFVIKFFMLFGFIFNDYKESRSVARGIISAIGYKNVCHLGYDDHVGKRDAEYYCREHQVNDYMSITKEIDFERIYHKTIRSAMLMIENSGGSPVVPWVKRIIPNYGGAGWATSR